MTLTEKIIELVPEIKRLSCSIESEEHYDSCYKIHPITLADVLRAMALSGNGLFYGVTDRGAFIEIDPDRHLPSLISDIVLNQSWNLTTNLDGQSPETKAFLEKILL